MGLDMYLYAEEYISGYNFTARLEPVATVAGMGLAAVTSTPAPDNPTRYRQVVDLVELGDMVDPNTPGVTVSATVAYWRKANQIHFWFVENVQDGVDECQRSYVRREQLIELRDLCQQVLAAREHDDGGVAVAEDVLPVRSGFFFGGTDYDEYYFEDLADTVKQLDRVLNHPRSEHVDFYYHSSW